jgi:3-oxoacyl-[acyl-carrier-protein] synthase II
MSTLPLDDDQRIVITGMGVVCPVGIGCEETWQHMLAGTSGIRPVTAFDTSDLDVHLAGEMTDFSPTPVMTPTQANQCGRASQLAICATAEAIAQAQLPLDTIDPFRVGVSFGTTMGEPTIVDQIVGHTSPDTLQEVPAEQWRRQPAHMIAKHVAGFFRLQGPHSLIPTACAAGNYAIGYASDLLRTGRADIMLAGGSDALARMAFVGFHKLRAMAPSHVAPFDRERKGMMIGEGAATLVLERLSDAKRRGAPILAELLSYGLGCDAHKMTIPHPEGLGGRRALQQALQRAQITPEQIDHISAHGTGTQENDRIETMIIKQVLGDHAYQCPVNSLKSMTGHCMGASSAIEAVICIQALRHGQLPPTINYQTPDPLCDLDYIPNEAREHPLHIVVSNAYAFGGNASSLILRKMD